MGSDAPMIDLRDWLNTESAIAMREGRAAQSNRLKDASDYIASLRREALAFDCGTAGSRPDGGLCHADARCVRCTDAAGYERMLNVVRERHAIEAQAAGGGKLAEKPDPNGVTGPSPCDFALFHGLRQAIDDTTLPGPDLADEFGISAPWSWHEVAKQMYGITERESLRAGDGPLHYMDLERKLHSVGDERDDLAKQADAMAAELLGNQVGPPSPAFLKLADKVTEGLRDDLCDGETPKHHDPGHCNPQCLPCQRLNVARIAYGLEPVGYYNPKAEKARGQ